MSFAAKLSIAYAVLAMAWIVASDAALRYFVRDAATLADIGTYKGAVFVVVTTVLLYVALAAQRRREIETRGTAVTRHFEQLANNINDSIILLDDRGQVVNVNDRAITTYGYGHREFLKLTINELRAPEARAHIADHMRLVKERGALVYETAHLRKDGSRIPVEISTRAINVGGRHFVQGIIRDVTEQKQSQQRILRLNRLYATLSGVNKAIVRCRSREELFAETCRVLKENGGFIGAGAALLDAATGRIVPIAASDTFKSFAAKMVFSVDPNVAEGRGPSGTAVRQGKPYFCNDVFADPHTVPWRALATEYRINALADIPLQTNGRTIGVLGVYSDIKNYFDEEVRALLEEMGIDLSFALENFGKERRRITAEQDTVRLSHERDRLLKRLQLEFEHMPIGCIVMDLDAALTVRDWNPAASAIFGYRKEETIGKSAYSLIVSSAIKPVLDAQVRELASSNRPIAHTIENTTKAGRIITCEWINAPLRDESGNTIGLLGMVQDVTARNAVDRALHESESMFRSLVEQSIAGIFIVVGGKLVYANPRCAEIVGYPQDQIVGKPAHEFISDADRMAVHENICKPIFTDAKAMQYAFRARRNDGADVDIGVHASLVSYKGDRAIIGVLQDISERRKAEEHARQYLIQLEKSMLGTIDAVSTMVELRDPYTSGHERRVGEIAAAIGAEMGMTDDEVKGLRITGHVHDIGKISVPAEILSKPGKLTKTEFEIIKTHAQLGYDILKSVEFPWPVAQTILQHHERLDGSGYPNGLKGDAIILPARIMAVADTVEAMATHRPYRPGLGIEAALKEIEEQSGRRYDPQVAAVCLRLFRVKNYTLSA